MPTLLEISDEMRSLDALLAEMSDNGGDISSVSDTLDKWFAEIGKDRDEKVDNYAALIRDFELRAVVRKEECERLAKRVRTDAAHAAFLKSRLQRFFADRNITKIETKRFSVGIVNNGGVLPLVIAESDPNRLPPEFVTIKTETVLNNEKIRAVLDAGQELPFAKYGERGQRLSIR